MDQHEHLRSLGFSQIATNGLRRSPLTRPEQIDRVLVSDEPLEESRDMLERPSSPSSSSEIDNEYGNVFMDQIQRSLNTGRGRGRGRGRGNGRGRGRGRGRGGSGSSSIDRFNSSSSIDTSEFPVSNNYSNIDNLMSDMSDPADDPMANNTKGSGKTKDVISWSPIGMREYDKDLDDTSIIYDTSCSEDEFDNYLRTQNIKPIQYLSNTPNRKANFITDDIPKEVDTVFKMGKRSSEMLDTMFAQASSKKKSKSSSSNDVSYDNLFSEEDEEEEEGEDLEEDDENVNFQKFQSSIPEKGKEKHEEGGIKLKRRKLGIKEKHSNECFLCVYDAVPSSAESNAMALIKKTIKDNTGRIGKATLCRLVHKIQKDMICVPMLKAGKYVPLLRTNDVYFHLTHCVQLQPEVFFADKLHKLNILADAILDHNCYKEEKLIDGSIRKIPDHDSIKSLRIINEMCIKMYEKNPSKLMFNNGEKANEKAPS